MPVFAESGNGIKVNPYNNCPVSLFARCKRSCFLNSSVMFLVADKGSGLPLSFYLCCICWSFLFGAFRWELTIFELFRLQLPDTFGVHNTKNPQADKIMAQKILEVIVQKSTISTLWNLSKYEHFNAWNSTILNWFNFHLNVYTALLFLQHDKQTYSEVWGRHWHSKVLYMGLIFCRCMSLRWHWFWNCLIEFWLQLPKMWPKALLHYC